MALAMSRPTKHPKTGIYQLRRRVPFDLIAKVGKKEIKRSLGTHDPVEAKKRFAGELAKLERHWQFLRAEPAPVPHKQIVALAGEAYRQLLRSTDDEPGEPSIWRTLQKRLDREYEAGNLEGWYGDTADRLLAEHGMKADQASRERLLEEIHRAVKQATDYSRRRAEGDYRPDPDAERFPSLGRGGHKSPSFDDLLTAWKKHGGITNPATARDWQRSLDSLASFLGHDDAARVTRADLHRWFDSLEAKGNSKRTIRDKKLAAIRSVYRAAQARQVVDHNPTDGIKVKVPKRTVQRSLGFTDSEAQLILSASRRALEIESRASERMKLAYRWVPWLCAYTGARAGEIAQLRRQDVRHKDEVPHLVITPEAGTVKTGMYRLVPLHPHLIEQGFLDFVRSRPDGPLFYEPRKGEEAHARRPWDNVRDRVGQFSRKHGKLTDRSLLPTHAWRHRFKTVARDAGISEEYHNAIQGHEDGTASRGYGEISLKALQREINKLPRCEAAPSPSESPTGGS